MNKQDLKEYILIRKEHIAAIISFGFQNSIHISPCIERILEWLDDIYEDLNINELIPDRYIPIIEHNIESLGLSNLPSAKDLARDGKEYFCILHDNYITTTGLANIERSIELYNLLKTLNFIKRNTVIVGANGCGKTSLATMLQQTLNKQDGIVIPAQKLLIVPTFDSIPNYDKTIGEYNSYQRIAADDKRTYDVNSSNDFPYDLMKQYGSEYKQVLSALLSERSAIRNRYCNKVQKDEEVDKSDLTSKLDIVISIWNSLIEHRCLICNDNNNLVLQSKDIDEDDIPNNEYPAWQTSDGERIMLYLIGRVLLAPKNALIFIDEPEMYLHKTIVDKLWDRLEYERKDCVFIYMTHDLSFATSRQAEKLWMKKFTYPNLWEMHPIENDEIPEDLLLTLLGSRKNILFCEGKPDSLDKPIFEILFPSFTICPVESCKNVINYTKAYNKISNTNSKAYGIIDRDFRTEEQLNNLKTENIFSYNVAEIENVFLIEDFIKGCAVYYHCHTYEMDKIKHDILDKLRNEKEMQVSKYVSSRINYYFSESHVKNANNKETIIKNFQNFQENINIDAWYDEREKLIDKIYKEKDYPTAIMIYNNKGLCKIIEHELKEIHYWEKAMNYLKDTHDIHPLLEVFPKELLEIEGC